MNDLVKGSIALIIAFAVIGAALYIAWSGLI